MTLQHVRLFFFVAFFTTLVGSALAQVSSEFWIYVRDSADPKDTATMYFGNHVNGSYGKDTLNETIVEEEYPPPGFGFDVRWVAITPTQPGEFAGGFIPFDYRGYTGPSQIDTFKLQFQNQDSILNNDFLFRWPNATYIGDRSDSMVLRFSSIDPDNPLSIRLNMSTVDSLVIPQAQIYNTSLRIFKYGVKIIDAVKQEKSAIPASFALRGNYPNPFNPSTTITFDVQSRSAVEVVVFNLLGQKVTTLVAEDLAPGTYSTVWNGLDARGRAVSSGVYFVSMTARSEGNAQFNALQKMLLMK